MADTEPVAPPLQPPLQNTSSPRDLEPDAADIERYKKWWEERKLRKLRGQYESAFVQLSQLVSTHSRLSLCALLTGPVFTGKVNENLSAPLNIASVRVRGAIRTRESFLGSIIDPYLAPSPDEPQTLGKVLQKTKEIRSLLEETDLFSHIETVIDRSRDALAHPDDVDVIFLAKEKGRYFLNTSTQVGNNEGGAVSDRICLALPVKSGKSHSGLPRVQKEIPFPN